MNFAVWVFVVMVRCRNWGFAIFMNFGWLLVFAFVRWLWFGCLWVLLLFFVAWWHNKGLLILGLFVCLVALRVLGF